jgi:alpha-tubulin suppressor-like RCC1 family protein
MSLTERAGLLFCTMAILLSQNVYGQLGDGTGNPSARFKKLMENVSAAAAGSSFSAALKADGTLWVTGNNDYGQLGTGDQTRLQEFRKIADDVVSVEASWNNLYFLKTDKSLWGCGDNSHGQLGIIGKASQALPQKILDHVKSFAPGAGHLLILTDLGELWVVGENDSGQLSHGTLTDSPTPKFCLDGVAKVAAGQYHSAVLKNDGSVWFCGSNLDKIISGDSSQSIPKFTKVFDGASDIFSNYCSNSLYIETSNGRLFGCGGEVKRIFGIQTKPKDFLPIADDVVAVSLGEQQLFILKSDDTLLGWASNTNNYGLLGDGTMGSKFGKIVITQKLKTVYAGIYHSLAIATNGDLLGTGFNGEGGLE